MLPIPASPPAIPMSTGRRCYWTIFVKRTFHNIVSSQLRYADIRRPRLLVAHSGYKLQMVWPLLPPPQFSFSLYGASPLATHPPPPFTPPAHLERGGGGASCNM